jgi:hypothetical protein
MIFATSNQKGKIMASAIADLLSIMGAWTGVGIILALVVGLKCWDIYKAHHRESKRSPSKP